jgi:lysozyme
MMHLSRKGLDLIKEAEGLRLKAYVCQAGKLTIGYGHVIMPGEPAAPITENEAEELLLDDVVWAEAVVNDAVKVRLTQGQFDALVSFVFNVGPGRAGDNGKDGFVVLRNGNPSSMLRLLNNRDYMGAAAQFKFWKHAGGKESAGLAARRLKEEQMFLGTLPRGSDSTEEVDTDANPAG